MARGYSQSRSEVAGFKQGGGGKYDADGILSDEDIKYRYSNTGYASGTPKLLRQDAKNQINAIFEKTSPFAELGLPDSPYIMDALDTMQQIAQGWADRSRGETPVDPTTKEVQEYKSIARRAVEQVNLELGREARELAADFRSSIVEDRPQNAFEASQGIGGGAYETRERNKRLLAESGNFGIVPETRSGGIIEPRIPTYSPDELAEAKRIEKGGIYRRMEGPGAAEERRKRIEATERAIKARRAGDFGDLSGLNYSRTNAKPKKLK